MKSDGRPALPPGTIIHEWSIIRVLPSSGIMGDIYQVEHVRRREKGALKLLKPEFASSAIAIQRAELEALAGARVEHPNLNTVLDAGDYEGRPFFVAPLLEGLNLRDWLTELGSLPIPDAIFIAMEVAAALAALHERARVIHRDVKPDNIFVTFDGEVKLLDLGVAKLLGTLKDKLPTNTGELPGSVAYLAPEQLETEATLASDLYSLALVLNEMIVGRHFQLDSLGRWPSSSTLLQRLLRHEIPAPLDQVVPGCPPSLAALVTRCLSASPAERPASARELRALLELELTQWQVAHLSGKPVASIFREESLRIATKRRANLPPRSRPITAPRSDNSPKVILAPNSRSAQQAEPNKPSTARLRSMGRRNYALLISFGIVLLLAAYAIATLGARVLRRSAFVIPAPTDVLRSHATVGLSAPSDHSA